jgi:hypothetical protein
MKLAEYAIERKVCIMKKKILLMVVCFISSMIVVNTLYGQGLTKTATLPNGDLVCDLNGEWNASVENYGVWVLAGSYPQVWKITQEGGSFKGVIMKDESLGNAKDSQAVEGELNKWGIKKVRILTERDHLDAKGQISDDGNQIIIDDGKVRKITITRK